MNLTLVVLLLLLLLFVGAATSSAEVAVLLEEPYGTFGAFNPTGHASVYLSGVCAASPTQLRRCQPGEAGVVISRYDRIAGRDWIAMPVIPFFYAVDRLQDVPVAPDRATVQQLRDEWRRSHLAGLAPDRPDGKAPRGDWHELIGVAYNRTTYAFQLDTTPEADDRLIERLNSRPNRRRFKLLFPNCADFVRNVVNVYYPHALRRSVLADAGIATPKQMARGMVRYGRRHPDLRLSGFTVRKCRQLRPKQVRASRAGGAGVVQEVRGAARDLPSLGGGHHGRMVPDGRPLQPCP